MSDNEQVTRTGADEDQQRAVLPSVDVFEDASGITLLADMRNRAASRSPRPEQRAGRPIDARFRKDEP